MNYITKYELDNKELASKFSIENGNLVFDENSKFKEDFQVGDIIVSKNNTSKDGFYSICKKCRNSSRKEKMKS